MEDFKGPKENSSEPEVEGRGGGQTASPLPGRLWFAIIDNISEYTGRYLSWLVVLITLFYFFEVIMRSIFNAPTIWAHESSTYLFGAYFMLGGAYALKRRQMVNVDIWVNKLTPRTRCLVDGVMSLVTLGFLFVLVYLGAQYSWASLMKNETSQTPWGPPIYPLKITAFVGAALVFIQALSQTIRNFIFAARGGAEL